jgi:hypothetical protein
MQAYKEVKLKLPREIAKKIRGFADNNGRDIETEIIARLALNIQQAEQLKIREELMELIFSSQKTYRKKN